MSYYGYYGGSYDGYSGSYDYGGSYTMGNYQYYGQGYYGYYYPGDSLSYIDPAAEGVQQQLQYINPHDYGVNYYYGYYPGLEGSLTGGGDQSSIGGGGSDTVPPGQSPRGNSGGGGGGGAQTGGGGGGQQTQRQPVQGQPHLLPVVQRQGQNPVTTLFQGPQSQLPSVNRHGGYALYPGSYTVGPTSTDPLATLKQTVSAHPWLFAGVAVLGVIALSDTAKKH